MHHGAAAPAAPSASSSQAVAAGAGSRVGLPGPCSADIPGSQLPLLWPEAVREPAELLAGAAAAEARVGGGAPKLYVPKYVQQGKQQRATAVGAGRTEGCYYVCMRVL